MQDALNTDGYPLDTLVFIGRFQPFHSGHLAVLEQALARAAQVVVVLGSAFKPRSGKNPFSAAEREAMIRLTLGERSARVRFVAMRDYHDDDKWAAQVLAAVRAICQPKEHVGIIGHDKDETSYYLHRFPAWEQVLVGNHDNLNATDLRTLYFTPKHREAGHALLATRVPAPVMSFLNAFATLPEFERLCTSCAKVAADKKAWEPAPYPPIFVTADAVIRCAGKVLLVQRGGALGYGQWALPGGFVEQDETLLAAAIREAQEETNIGIGAAYLRQYLADTEVFDYPGRSERGRTVTFAHFFDLTSGLPPSVTPGSDAIDAKWVDESELAGMEAVLFEDHFAILDRFLHIH